MTATIISQPIPAALPPVPHPTSGVRGSVSMWDTVIAALRKGRRSPVVEVMLPRTVPVLVDEDVTPYHLIEADGKMSLRKGAPPSAVRGAAADFAQGSLDLDGFLDRIGVPKS